MLTVDQLHREAERLGAEASLVLRHTTITSPLPEFVCSVAICLLTIHRTLGFNFRKLVEGCLNASREHFLNCTDTRMHLHIYYCTSPYQNIFLQSQGAS